MKYFIYVGTFIDTVPAAQRKRTQIKTMGKKTQAGEADQIIVCSMIRAP